MAEENAANGSQDRKQVRVRINAKDVKPAYINGFRSNVTAEEVVLDLGMNTVLPQASPDGEDVVGEVQFDVSTRLVMNYHTAKRLTLALSNVLRQHEERFGEIQVGPAR